MKKTLKTLGTGIKVMQTTNNGTTRIFVELRPRHAAFNRSIATI
jgi:hypothetical protein